MPRAEGVETWSAYDELVPRTTGLPAARERLAELRRRRPGSAGDLASVREVIVVASSSRGGSTLVGELLRQCPGLLHLRAEVNPLFVVAGLEDGGRRQVLAAELAAEVGRPAVGLGPEEVDELCLAVAWRLSVQWPLLEIDVDDVDRWVRETLAELGAADPSWASIGFADRQAFHLRLLHRARAAHPQIDPWYYDLPAHAVRASFPDVPPPDGPPGQALIEMPPFVLVGPWRRPSAAELAALPLVLTTPRNSFRLEFLRSLFPLARLRVVHLTRNPAASVNGLVDGWLHHGFFNCPVGRRLTIRGYSDEHPRWGTTWWCYDFWPEWEAWTDASLAEVCAEQWRTPHQATLDFLASTDASWHRLVYEEVTGGDDERAGAFTALGEWLGDVEGVSDLGQVRLPPLMATATPRPRRWKARAAALAAPLARVEVAELAERLGYGDPSMWR